MPYRCHKPEEREAPAFDEEAVKKIWKVVKKLRNLQQNL